MKRSLSRAEAISIGAAVLGSDPAVRHIAVRGVVFRNPLWRQGYADLEAIRAEDLQKAILEVITARGLAVDDAFRAALAGESDVETLKTLLRRAATAASTAEVLTPRD